MLVASYRGAFVRRVAGREVFVDGSVAYLSAPGTVEEFAHPVPGGDVCTVIRFDPGLIAALSGGAPELADPALPMNGASELALRQATELARIGDPDGSLAERVARLASGLLARRFPDRVASGRPATAAARRRLVSQTKAALAADSRLGLVELSRLARLLPAPPQPRVHPAHRVHCQPVPEPEARHQCAAADWRRRAGPRHPRG